MIDIPMLETPRLTLRAPRQEDWPPLAAFYAGERAAFVGGPMEAGLVWRGLASELGHWHLRGYGRWSVVEKATDQFCGIVGLWYPEDWPEPEIGWDLVDAAEGRGIAYEAAMASRAYAYETLGWSTVISLIAVDNVRSAALAQRMGAIDDGAYTHIRHGAMRVFRHPSPEALSAASGSPSLARKDAP